MAPLKRTQPTLGVLTGWQSYPGTLDSFLEQVLHGAQVAAKDHGCNLMLGCGIGPNQDLSSGKAAWPIVSSQVDFVPVGHWNTDGLIFVPPVSSEAASGYILTLRQMGFPHVYAGDRESGPSVLVDNIGGVRQAVFHLHQHGHREIAFISGRNLEDEGDSRVRYRAYLGALRDLGLPVNPDLIAQGHHNLWDGRRAMEQILSRGAKFSAVIASNDQSADGVMEALRAARMKIPDRVAVIGFDDRLEARAQEPPLTTVHFPMFELGYQSVELLLKLIQQGTPSGEIIRIPTFLITRESCGCRPGSSPSLAQESQVGETRFPPYPTALPGGGKVESATLNIAQAMTGLVYNDLLRLSFREVSILCQQLVEAFTSSLIHADEERFYQTARQVLEEVVAAGDDLFAWQNALSVLREHSSALRASCASSLLPSQMEDMLHRARILLSEISRVQHTRILLRQANHTDLLSRVSARFFSARSEEELFSLLGEELQSFNIRSTAIAFYETDEQDTVSQSILKTAQTFPACPTRYATRNFPPPGMYTPDEPFRLVILPLLGLGDISGYISFETDQMEMCALITRQLVAALWGVRLYRQALEAQRLAEERRQQAEEANQLKSRFLSMVSHELRTPVNLIYGLSDMLLLDQNRTQARTIAVDREDIERIHMGAEHLVNLIRDVLDLASSQLDQLKLVLEALDLKNELRSIAAIANQLAQAKNLVLRTEIDEQLPAVYADRTRIRQIILNLLNNAVKFTSQGEIILRANLQGGAVRISIQDTGLGIPLEEQDSIFEEFQQSRRTSARGFGGLGLGLAICKRLVEMHGGQIGVESSGEEGQGSTFFFTLTNIVSEKRTASLAGQPPAANKLLLLVSDTADGREMQKQLEQSGVVVILHQVVDDYRWLERVLLEQPQAIVLDMPLASHMGWKILKSLKDNPSTQDLPVMVCSMEEAAGHGSLLELDYLTKPITSADLNRILKTHGWLDNVRLPEGMKTILIVDDECGILELHSRMVQAQYPLSQVIQAHNGREALQILRHQHPDLVLLDLMMPEVDGFTVLKSMQEDEASRSIPVVILTGQTLSEEDLVRLNTGVTRVLGKGMYTIPETLQHIGDAIERRRKVSSDTQRVVFKAMAYLQAHYSAPITRKDVAEFAGLSERHLTRCFNQELGISPMTYLNRFRVKQAKEYLENGRKSIAEIAEIVGFSSGGYFTRVFRQEVGCSPRDYACGKR